MRELYRAVWRVTGRQQILLIGLSLTIAGLAAAPLKLQQLIINSLVEHGDRERLAWLCAAFLGVVLAFMRESFDTSIGTIEGIEEFLKVPVLGVIPQFNEQELRAQATKVTRPEEYWPSISRTCASARSRMALFSSGTTMSSTPMEIPAVVA